MRSWPAGLVAELQSAAPRLALGLLIQRADGLRIAASAADLAVTLSGIPIDGSTANGVLFDPAADNTRINLSAVARSAGTEVDNLEAQVVEGGLMTIGDVLQGRWAGAAFTLFIFCWADASMGIGVVTFGEVGKIKPRVGFFEVELRDIRQRLGANTTWVAQKDCRWEYGSTSLGAGGGLCGVPLGPVTFDDVPVTTVTSSRQITASSLGQADGYFANGLLTFNQSATGATTDAAGYAIGEDEITLDTAGAGPILATDVVTFEGDDTEYTVTVGDADVSGGGTITITPPLVRAIAAAETAVTVRSNLAGITVRVRAFAAGAVTLDMPMVFEIPLGIAFTIVRGCRKRWDVDCRDTHDNLRRFGGEKEAPGPDKAQNMKFAVLPVEEEVIPPPDPP